MMDCEKCEPLLLDELYEELDEVTSAAVKRHVSGCARCASVLNGLRSTRRLVQLPALELPEGLEDRILSSVKAAQKVVPLAARGTDASAQSRAARALSWAGSWAMRPQTAMAAVFLLMIGTSAFVIRSRHSSERAAAVSVTEQGIPAGEVAADDDQVSLDSKAAAAAHGPNQPSPVTHPPVATAAPGAAAASGALAFGDRGDPLGGAMDGFANGPSRSRAEGSGGLGALATADDKNKDEGALAREKKGAAPSEIGNAAAPAGAPLGEPDRDYAPRGQTVAPPPAKAAMQEPQDGFSAGMAAYRARNFAEATRQFDGAARSGDQNAALWAAKSVKDGNGGCLAAIPRFDAVAQRSGSSWIGSEAQLEAARCQIALGQLDAARDRLARLTKTPSHAGPAQHALNELNQVATKREAERSKAAAGGGRAGTAAPARAARPAATTSKPATAVDRDSAY